MVASAARAPGFLSGLSVGALSVAVAVRGAAPSALNLLLARLLHMPKFHASSALNHMGGITVRLASVEPRFPNSSVPTTCFRILDVREGEVDRGIRVLTSSPRDVDSFNSWHRFLELGKELFISVTLDLGASEARRHNPL